MKVRCTPVGEGKDREMVFDIPAKPEAGEIRLVVRSYGNGKAMLAEVQPWMKEHGATL